MSEKEADHYHLFKEHQDGKITLGECSELLQLSYRQTLRWWKRFKEEDKIGLISRKRGRKSNRALSKETSQSILSYIQKYYCGFGPTLAAEKLEERQNITVSRETVRKIMIKNELWIPNKKKKHKYYQRRQRRERYGDLVQIDGSPHDWFEGRREKCVLLVAIDDATGEITARFEESETVNGYFRLLSSYIQEHGIPQCFYSDRHSIFQTNHGEKTNKTQFKRALDELGIRLICAHSPQAKGRVERANQTLQDRLVKEMRLEKISSIEKANKFLPHYLKQHNKRFAISPIDPINTHRQTLRYDLENILCNKEIRTITKNLEIQYKRRIFQIQHSSRGRSLSRHKVMVIEKLNGDILLESQGQYLEYKEFEVSQSQPETVDYNELAKAWVDKKKYTPPLSHPWKRNYRKKYG